MKSDIIEKKSSPKKTAIITGASSGIGYATALYVAKRGINVVVAARRVDKLKQLVQEIKLAGGSALAVKCDVSNKEDNLSMVESAVKTFGSVDFAFLNAGVCSQEGKPVWETDINVIMKNFDVNVKGTFLGVQAITPQMIKQKRGAIVINTSICGLRALPMISNPGITGYSSSKFALTGLMQYLAVEVAKHNIRVNCVAPGAIETDMTGHSVSQLAKEMHLFPKPGKPVDVAKAVQYLFESEFVTGTTMSVDGGALIK